MDKILCILVDPSQVNMLDIEQMEIPYKSDFRGIAVLRYRRIYWGRVNPIEVFFINSQTITFKDLKSLEKYLDTFNLDEESKNG